MPEMDFFRDLRSVAVHLIKHVQDNLYQPLVDVVEAEDEGQWHRLSDGDKLTRLRKLETLVPQLDAYYETYPHHWSRQRYAEFKEQLAGYMGELEQRARAAS
jgi:hypothetical protein